MNKEQSKNELLKLAKENPFGYRSMLKHSRKELLEEVLEFTSWMPSDADFTTRIWYFLHDMSSWLKCAKEGCNNEVRRKMKAKDFERTQFFCCNKHAQQDESTIAKVKATKKVHFGDENFNNKAKASQTLMKKHGVTNAFNIPSIVQAKKERNLKLHGNPNWNNQNKARDTVAKKLEEDADYWKKREQKSKETKIANGYDPNWHNKEKANQTCIERYGVKHGCCTQKAKEKREEVMLKKYGNKSFFKTRYFNEVTRKENGKKQKRKFYRNCILHNENVFPLFSEEEYANVHECNHIWKWKCKKCENEFEAPFTTTRFLFDFSYARCPMCYPFVSGKSEMEKEMAQFIKNTIGSENVTCNERTTIKPFEIDVLVENKKIAFEFDGLYYHGIKQGKPADYHLMKTNMCEAKGIQLIHIFEDEWLYKRPIVESRIKNLLGVYDKTVFARKCEIREVSSSESMEFQEVNHIQGHCKAKVHLGLFHDDQLISLMTFGKSRFNKKVEWELLRFCNKLGYHVPGGAGKLLKHFEKAYSPKSLISYADRRWSRGKLYEALGFKLDHVSAAAYWYVKNQRRYSRVLFQKHKLKDLLDQFDPNKSEQKNMLDNGYDMIFDCGNLAFIKNYS